MDGMKMIDMGTKQSKMFPSAVESKGDSISYPEIRMPLKMIEGLNCKVDDEVDIHIKGRISGMEDTKWSKNVTIECKQGAMAKAGKTAAKSSSVMDENK